MESPNFDFPQQNLFSIPYSPKHLNFNSSFMDKNRFQKLNVDKRMLKLVCEHLTERIDNDVLFYLKFLGINDCNIVYKNNKVIFHSRKGMLNEAIPLNEYPVDEDTETIYHMGEGSGVKLGDERNTFDLTWNGTWDERGKVRGNAGYFDGINDYGYDADLLTVFPTNGTIEMWFAPTATIEAGGGDVGFELFYKKLAASNYFESFLYDLDGKIYFFNRTSAVSAVTAQTTWTANTWYHVAFLWGTAVTWGRAGMKIIVNNAVDGENADTGKPAGASPTNFYLGCNNIPTNFLPARMDEVRVSSRQRSYFGGLTGGVIG